MIKIKKINIALISTILIMICSSNFDLMAEEDQPQLSQLSPTFTQPGIYHYTYKDREHTWKEDAAHLSVLYTLGWFSFYISQTEIFINEGSWRNFKTNFGKFVFDHDEPTWNWIGHPYTGSQVYLYYRANGYSQLESVKMTFLQSALFEFATEIYTEPASIQDLYQTPILGAALGLILEHTSLYLINTDNPISKVLGHMMNPSTLFWFYEGKVKVFPTITPTHSGISLYVEY